MVRTKIQGPPARSGLHPRGATSEHVHTLHTPNPFLPLHVYASTRLHLTHLHLTHSHPTKSQILPRRDEELLLHGQQFASVKLCESFQAFLAFVAQLDDDTSAVAFVYASFDET